MKQTIRTHSERVPHSLTLARQTAITLFALLLTFFVPPTTAWADDGYNYIGADGQQRNTYTDDHIPDNDVIPLTGSEKYAEIYQEDGQDGWYVVTGKVTYSAGLYIEGHNDNVNLILCDDAEISISCLSEDYSALNVSGYHFNIYGQTAGSGKLIATNSLGTSINASVWWYDGNDAKKGSFTINGGVIETSGYEYGIQTTNGSFIINGGSVKARGEYENNDYGIGINAEYGTITINGGTVNALGTYCGIKANNTSICRGNVTAIGDDTGIYLSDGITISGGTVEARGENTEYGKGIYSSEGYITINGGNVTVSGTDGINIDGYITLGWTNASDRITVSSFILGGSVEIADGLSFHNGDKTIDKDYLVDGERSDIQGVTLIPYGMTIKAKPATGKEGYWTTLYRGDSGFDIETSTANAYVATYAIDGTTETTTLHNIGKTIPKGTGVVIVGSDEDIALKVNADATTYNGTYTNDLHGVDVKTPVSEVMTGAMEGLIPFVLSYQTEAGFGFYPWNTANDLPAHKAFLALSASAPSPSQATRELNMVFGEETTSVSEKAIMNKNDATATETWYSLDGRRLTGKPSKNGVYVVEGKKVVIR